MSRIQRFLWRAIYFILRAGPDAVLNPEPVPVEVRRPDRELYQAARQVQAEFIDAEGRRVDYERLRGSEAYERLRRAARRLPNCSLDSLEVRQARLAFWINLYNALILDAVVSYGIEDKIRPRFFLKAAYDVCGLRFTADHIEHGVLRRNRPHPIFRLPMFPGDDPRRKAMLDELDPRVHLALNCAASSCPPIEVYDPEEVDQQLDLACSAFINGDGVQVDWERGVMHISRIFAWYEGDFGGREGVLAFIANYSRDEELADLVRAGGFELEYLPYDWSLNRLV